MRSYPHRIRRALPAWGVMALVLFAAVAAPAAAGAQLELSSTAHGSQVDVNWLWVVPRLVLHPQDEWTLSAFFAGLGSCELDLALLDREGTAIAHRQLKLVAGQPDDYRLGELKGISTGMPLTLVVSGLRASPDALAFALTAGQAGGCERELRGSWLKGDLEWVPGLKGKR